MRIIANLREPDGGSVRYMGKSATQLGKRTLSRRLAYLAQDGDVHWPMRVESLIALGRLPYRRPFQELDGEDHRAIETAMAAADVTSFRARTMAEISGGERMRVLLARALAVEAELLLADEPIAALDPLHQLQVMTLLREIAQAGRGIVVVLHDLALAARFCDRLVLLAEGQVLADGAADRVLTDAHVERAYGVEVLRGERQGIPYVLPWTPVRRAEQGKEERYAR